MMLVIVAIVMKDINIKDKKGIRPKLSMIFQRWEVIKDRCSRYFIPMQYDTIK